MSDLWGECLNEIGCFLFFSVVRPFSFLESLRYFQVPEWNIFCDWFKWKVWKRTLTHWSLRSSPAKVKRINDGKNRDKKCVLSLACDDDPDNYFNGIACHLRPWWQRTALRWSKDEITAEDGVGDGRGSLLNLGDAEKSVGFGDVER